MNWLRNLLARLFGRKEDKKQVKWDELAYGKPSTAGDDFRKQNEV